MEIIKIETEYIKLGQLLKFASVTGSGGEARNLIQDGLVYVNDEKMQMRGKKIFPGDIIEIKELSVKLKVER